MGVDGIDIGFGLTTTSGKRGFARICGPEDVEQVITDAGISGHMAETLKGMGIGVTIV